MIIAIIGCSYTHYKDSNSLFGTYPYFLSKKYPEHDIVDLSVPGGSNDSAFMRLQWYEQRYGKTVDKVVMQITHLYRTFIHSKAEMYKMQFSNIDLFNEIYSKDNYFYTDGVIDRNIGMHMSMNSSELKLEWINKHFNRSFRESKEIELATWKSQWQTKQVVDLINATYDAVFFNWNEHIGKNMKFMPYKKNILQLGSVEKLLGTDYFERIGKPVTYHFGKLEQEIILDHLIESKFFESKYKDKY